MRIGLHWAEVHIGYDPIRKCDGVVGASVNLPARIEPIVPVNHIYATKQFIGALDATPDPAIAWDEVGSTELAKGWGNELLFNLRWKTETFDPSTVKMMGSPVQDDLLGIGALIVILEEGTNCYAAMLSGHLCSQETFARRGL